MNAALAALVFATGTSYAAAPDGLDGVVVQLDLDGKPAARFDAIDPKVLRWVVVETSYGEDRRAEITLAEGPIEVQLRERKGKWDKKALELRDAFVTGTMPGQIVLVVTRSTPTLPAGTRCVVADGTVQLASLQVSDSRVTAALAWTPGKDGDCSALTGDPEKRER